MTQTPLNIIDIFLNPVDGALAIRKFFAKISDFLSLYGGDLWLT